MVELALARCGRQSLEHSFDFLVGWHVVCRSPWVVRRIRRLPISWHKPLLEVVLYVNYKVDNSFSYQFCIKIILQPLLAVAEEESHGIYVKNATKTLLQQKFSSLRSAWYTSNGIQEHFPSTPKRAKTTMPVCDDFMSAAWVENFSSPVTRTVHKAAVIQAFS